MTRDEAINKLVPYGSASNAMTLEAQKFIDRLEVLGLLKLDEPMSGKDKFRDAMALNGVYLSLISIEMALSHAGLKIVEK